MINTIPLITTLASALGLALVFGFIAARLKLPVILGYLLTGILVGPYTPGYIANTDIAKELAEIGVMLLMFGVGLHFSLKDLIAVRKIALPGAMLQIIVATLLGTWIATHWGFSLGGSVLFGISLSVASTVVLLRALEAQNTLESISGRIAIGWLVVEDLAMVIVIVMLPPLAAWLNGKPIEGMEMNLIETLGFTLLKMTAFIVFMIVVGYRIFPKILWQITRTGSRELFTLCVVATAITIAFLSSKLFGVSFALGAFFSGMMMRESPLSHRAAEESLPLREAFAVLFFVSVGMLFDPRILFHHAGQVCAVTAIIIFGKSLATLLLVLCFRYSIGTALLISVSLAQIGEFSFILAALGVELGLLPPEGLSLIVAGAFISIALNPLLFKLTKSLQHWMSSHPHFFKTKQDENLILSALPKTTDEKFLSGQVVLVGDPLLRNKISEILFQKGIPYLISEIPSNANKSTPRDHELESNMARTSMLMLAIPDQVYLKHLIQMARKTNPKIEIIVCAYSEDQISQLSNETIEKVFYDKYELIKNISQYILDRYGIASSSG